jgi:ribosomal protein L10
MLNLLKSKEEVIGEIIGLLQSPAKRVISALKNQVVEKLQELLKRYRKIIKPTRTLNKLYFTNILKR